MKFKAQLEGRERIRLNLSILKESMMRQGNQSGWNQAQHLFSRTRAVVPYMNGDLYGAAFIMNISPSEYKRVWAVGYDTVQVPYAVSVHEVPDRNHPTRGPSPEPKQDHFLSEPRDQMEKDYYRTVGDDMKAAIRASKGVR